MHKSQKNWDKLEALLRLSLQEVRPELTAKSIELIEEFIDHNEFGLAYEFIIGAIEDQKISVSEVTQAALQDAASLMNL